MANQWAGEIMKYNMNNLREEIIDCFYKKLIEAHGITVDSTKNSTKAYEANYSVILRTIADVLDIPLSLHNESVL